MMCGILHSLWRHRKGSALDLSYMPFRYPDRYRSMHAQTGARKAFQSSKRGSCPVGVHYPMQTTDLGGAKAQHRGVAEVAGHQPPSSYRGAGSRSATWDLRVSKGKDTSE